MNASSPPPDPALTECARSILEGRRKAYENPATLVDAHERDFPHLHLGSYHLRQRRMESCSFRFTGDGEIPHIGREPGSVHWPTFIRFFISECGEISSNYYQIRMREGVRARTVLQQLLVGGLKKAIQEFFRFRPLQHYEDLETEFSDGSFLTTTNAEDASAIRLPAVIEARFFSYGTSIEKMLEHHRTRIADILRRNPNLTTVRFSSLDDIRASEAKRSVAKNEYRQIVRWVTREELRQLSNDSQATADAVYEEIQRLLEEEISPDAERPFS